MRQIAFFCLLLTTLFPGCKKAEILNERFEDGVSTEIKSMAHNGGHKLSYNLTNGETKSWKVNPKGVTSYCGQYTMINPPLAMDDIFIFNANGSFSHKGGANTYSDICFDGGDYDKSWAFNSDQTSIILDGWIELKIVRLQKSKMILRSIDSDFDLIPNK